jgi:hypothetical protein
MTQNPSFDALARQLLRRGLPGNSVARYVEELRDHRQDLLAELAQQGVESQAAERLVGARLGDMHTLAAAALEAHRRQSLMGRQAWFFFGVLPALATPVTTFLLVVAAALSSMWIADVMGKPEWHLPAVTWSMVAWGCDFMNYVWPGCLCILLYRAAWRRGLAWGWRSVSCGFVIAWGAWLHCTTTIDAVMHHGSFMMSMQLLPHWTQATAAVTLVAAYAALRPWRAGRMIPAAA